jgi:hypothetical protein
MSVIQDAEQAAEKVFHFVEDKVEEFDGAALAEARRLLADAKAAEGEVLDLAAQYKTQLIALAEQYGPEAVAALEQLGSKLITDIEAVLGVA